MTAGTRVLFDDGQGRWIKGVVYCSSDPGDSVLVRDAAGSLHFVEAEQVQKRTTAPQHQAEN